jgi:hypothetical protein
MPASLRLAESKHELVGVPADARVEDFRFVIVGRVVQHVALAMELEP